VFALHVGGREHLHLCFDGNGEPPATVHLSADGVHHAGEGANSVHHDVDVSLTSDALAKKFGSHEQHPALLAAAYLLFPPTADASVELPLARVAPIEPFPSFRRLPPLRAPPV